MWCSPKLKTACTDLQCSLYCVTYVLSELLQIFSHKRSYIILTDIEIYDTIVVNIDFFKDDPIEKNCELIQEYSFPHPQVKSKANRSYTSSFSRSTLWDLISSLNDRKFGLC